jgi:hypothetical protein
VGEIDYRLQDSTGKAVDDAEVYSRVQDSTDDDVDIRQKCSFINALQKFRLVGTGGIVHIVDEVLRCVIALTMDLL